MKRRSTRKFFYQHGLNKIAQKIYYLKRHEVFTTIVSKNMKYRELKESMRMVKSQRNNIERNKLIEDCKIISIDKIIKQNGRINNNLKALV